MRNAHRHRLEAYLDRLFGFAVSLAGDRDRAGDLVQDCALKALAARRVPADEPTYRAWLFRILRNSFIDRQREENRRPGLSGLDTQDSDPFPPALAWRGDHHLVNALTVRLAIDRLSIREREMLALIDVAGLTYGEAAAVLGIPTGTVTSRISRARQGLLVILNESNIRAFPKRLGKGPAA